MNLKEVIKISFTFFKRSKKKIVYSIILFLSTMLLLLILIANNNLENVFKIGRQSILYKSFQVFDSSRREELSNELAEELRKLEHVNDAYPFEYENSGLGIDIEVEGKKLILAFERRTEKDIPKLKSGRKYNDDETNVMICPERILDENNGEINIFEGKKLLNKEIEGTYYTDEIDATAISYRKDGTKNTETFTVIGTYENENSYPSYSTCFLPPKEIDRLYSVKRSKYDKDYLIFAEENLFLPQSSNAIIVIDKYSNTEEVKKVLEEKGYEVEPRILLDRSLFKTFYIVAGIIMCISIFTIAMITASYAKKKLLIEEQNIKVMQTEGLTKKDIGLIYAGEIFINNFIVYIITSIIAIITTLFIVNNIDIAVLEFNLLTGIDIGIINYLIAFIIMVFLPSIYIYYRINIKKNK